ncbi:MAG: GntR family transcriptional regulator [Dehalococcoidales bacterium]|nr:GntR family transcriptional regulator [Dehalococcoidales bacterium]
MDTLTPVTPEHRALWEGAARALRRGIILGEIEAGARLDETQIANKLGVSRLPVREAFAQLAREGLVRIEPRRGAFAVGITDADISALYDVRSYLECHAVRQAIRVANDSDIARLFSLVEQMEGHLHNGMPRLIVEPDLEFHRWIVSLPGNRWLVSAWETMVGVIEAMLSITDLSADMTGPVAGHRRLATTIRERDEEGAVELMSRHRGAARLLIGIRQAAREVNACCKSTTGIKGAEGR